MLETDAAFAGSIPEGYDRHMVPLIFAPYAADIARRAASLGGFKQSSQHPDVGGCDEHWKAAVGSVWTSAITVTRSAACDGAQ